MKSYLPLIASVLLVSTSCNSSVAEIEPQKITQSAEISNQETETIATGINPYIEDNIAPEISVKISSAENGGSGVIIAQQDNTYLVLTNNHVLRDDDEFTIDTHDGVTHQATEVEKGIDTDDDLALLQFKSDKSYQTATINTAATPQAEQTILAVGYSAETGKLVTESGKIERIPDKTLKEGYSIGYTSNIVQGMSGGAILNTDGEVIGINGKSAFPIVNTGYTNEDGTEPSVEEIEQLRKLSWGLFINRLLAQVNPEIITAYNLPLPETTDSIENDPLTGWLGDLEARAKQISVRIDSSSGANGSGVIIAKEGNTYAVLTADHVICEKDDDRKCIDYTYEIVAPDGKKYPVNIDTVKRQEGVDLAVVRFDSDEQYTVAELADYPITNGDEIFVAGYPKSSNNTASQWLFSLGRGFDREQGLFAVQDDSLSSDNGVSSIQSRGSLSGGYEMVYTSITYGGMSGGAILDRDGRVIGIHGLAEGQTALNSRNASAKQVQMGYSLGVPIKTFAGLVGKFKINVLLPIQENRPEKLNLLEKEAFVATILDIEIPQENSSAETWLERGNQLWRLGRFPEAVEAFDRSIALNPKFAHLVYYAKGLALLSKQEDEAALASLELAINDKPDFAPALLYKSSILQNLNQLNEALMAVKKNIKLQENNANLYNQKGEILKNLKQYSKAEVAYSQAIKINPRSSFYSNRGNLYRKQGRWELALANYNRALEINPEFVNAYLNRGILYRDQEKLKLALADHNRALEINSEDDGVYASRGLVYQQQGKLKLAIVNYNSALRINPELAAAYGNRGSIYAKEGRWELALADHNRALKINSELAEVYYSRAFVYQQQGKLHLTLADYTRALEINPEDDGVYFKRGLIYAQEGKLELALADYNRTLKINPQFASAYNNRGYIYSVRGKLKLALANYNRALQIDPDNIYAYNNREFLYKELKRSKLAQISKSNPQSPKEYYDRAFKYHQQQEYDLALADYSQVIELDPNNEKAFINRGLIYYSQGKDELALADYNKAIAINPNNSTSYTNRGIIYFEQSDYELAQADWDKAIAIDPEDAQTYYNRGLLHKKLENYPSAKSDLEMAQRLATLQENDDLAKNAVNTLQQLP